MKKSLSLLLCLLLLASALPATAATQPTFTLMVYLCGTDLESDGGMATRDLTEIQSSGIPVNGTLTVYVQTGGTKRWQASMLADRECERWTLDEEGIQKVDGLGRQNMGDPDTLASFIKSGFENFPADRYGLILWNHGGGATGGVCNDELTQDTLYNPEIYSALKTATKGMKGKAFDFIGFDACLMGGYETALHVSSFADYLVGSEELEPGTGWSYDGWLPALVKNPDISTEALCRQIVDSYIQSVAYNRSEYATLSVVKLSALKGLSAAVEQMAEALDGEIDAGNLSKISRIRQNVRSFGEISSSYASDMVDLNTFAEVFASYDEAAAKELKAALKKAVVYSKHTSNLTGVSGLSILVPFSTRGQSAQYLPYYKQAGFSPAYTKFVESMLSSYGAGSGLGTGSIWDILGTPSVSQQSIESAQIDWFGQYAQDEETYQQDANSLWGNLYGGDMTEENQSDFSLDSFLNTLFGSEDSGASFNESYDDSQSSLWGDMSQYSDTSFATDGASLIGSLLGGGGQEAATETAAPMVTPQPETLAPQEVTVATADGDVVLDNPFAGSDSDYAYTVQLTQEQLSYLGKVEANLMMDVSDPDFECYVELGYVQDVVTDWNRGKIYGMFNGTWATLDGQMVCLYDQISNERYIRSLVPCTLNGDDCYLLVIFDDETPGGRVAGATEGYTDSGMPARGMTALEKGDVIVPMYELIYWDENGEQQTEPFEGEETIAGKDGSVPFAYSAVETDADYAYGFCLTDIYGDATFTDFLTLTF